MALHDETFLSCLFGSEHRAAVAAGVVDFLSCLFGSEQGIDQLHNALAFLSCLFGSERLPRTSNPVH